MEAQQLLSEKDNRDNRDRTKRVNEISGRRAQVRKWKQRDRQGKKEIHFYTKIEKDANWREEKRGESGMIANKGYKYVLTERRRFHNEEKIVNVGFSKQKPKQAVPYPKARNALTVFESNPTGDFRTNPVPLYTRSGSVGVLMLNDLTG